jgi:hypothetical protein
MIQNTITAQEFDDALAIVTAYYNQTVKTQNTIIIPEGRKINIQDSITHSMFNALVIYYKAAYKIDLKKADLAHMDVNLLAAIDYSKFTYSRGLGAVRIMKFKKIMQLNAVIK